VPFGDIIILAKGKLKTFPNNTYFFEEFNDVCEYECQNNADKYLENVIALWMVEKIRHRDKDFGYRFDLKFTIVPITNEMGNNELNRKKSLEDRLRNQVKKTFILRDTDYPKYFQTFNPKALARRADSFDQRPNNLMQVYNVMPNSYSVPDRLNIGEFYKKPIQKPPPSNGFYIPNINHRYPIRFPDSREGANSRHPSYNRFKYVRDEEKQEAHNVLNIVDHRGAIDLSNKSPLSHQPSQPLQNLNPQTKPLPGRSTTGLYLSQPAIAFPLIVPQMPMSILQVAPYTIPFQLQVSTPNSNQILYTAPHHNQDVTTFRYPSPPAYLNQQQIPQFQYLPKINQSKEFRESEKIKPQVSFSQPDPIYYSSTTEKPIQPTQYTPKLSNYVTASSIQINSYDNNDFRPIISPYSKNKKFARPELKSTINDKPLKPTISSSNSISNSNSSIKIIERNRNVTSERKEKPNKLISSIPTTTTDFPPNHDNDYTNYYDIVATRKPSIAKRTTTEKPILKWLPKKYRNKTLTATTTSTTQAPTTSANVETTINQSKSSFVYPTTKASHTSHVFRGKNRFYNSRRNFTNSSVNQNTTISPHTPLKVWKRKLTTTLLPIITTTQQTPSSIVASTTIIPTFVTSSYEINEPVTLQSYSTSVSLEANEKKIDTTQASFELIKANIDTIKSNSSNINIYKASDSSDQDNDGRAEEKIDEIASSILEQANNKSFVDINSNNNEKKSS
jgi:hypothetical protein